VSGWEAALVAGAVGLVVGGVGSLGVRPLIAAVPEPEPEPEPEPGEDAEPAAPKPPKELYAAIAARPGLTPRAVAAGAVGGGLIGLGIGWAWALVLVLPLVPVGVALAIIDLRTRLLPTRIVLPATGAAVGLGIVVAAIESDWHALVRAVIALVVVRSVFWVMWFIHASGMGFGDVRLSALLGFVLGFLGWAQVVIGIYAGFLEFVLPGLLVALVRRDRTFLRARVPFGPFLVLGAVTGIVVGAPVASALGY
jgi:leader peptidase (prepilin peptidase)/N-methyltransferase